jgi:hypothetical protein
VIRLVGTLLWIALGSTKPSAGVEKTVWMVVGASDASPAGIAKAAKGLAVKFPVILIFQTSDCGDKQNVFGVALEVSDSPDAAKVSLARARGIVKDAYIKRCAAVPQSLLDLRFQAVDLSIAGVPDNAVNWDDTDRLSKAIKLPDGRVVVAQRVFVEDPEDPMEGRQVRVILVGGSGRGKTLDDDCFTPERFKSRDGLIAFQCASEEAGDQLLHIVVVFDKDGKQLANVNHCRNPNLPNDATATCSEESYGPRGLKLRPKRVALTKGGAAGQRPTP